MQPTTSDIAAALSAAVRQWSDAARRHELLARAFADAEAQLAAAQRDLHELARALEVSTGEPVTTSTVLTAELVSKAMEAPYPAESATNGQTVTMPVVPTTAPQGDVDAAAEVLQWMKSAGGTLPGAGGVE